MRNRKYFPLDKTYEEAFGEATQKDFERLWSRVAVAGPSECWLWTNKYGAKLGPREPAKIYIQGKEWRAPRFIMMAEDAEVTPETQVFHVCEYYSCCNPAHLRIGSHYDRVEAVMARGGMARGERNGHYTCPEATPRGEEHSSAKLSEDQVREILAAFAAGDVTLAELGRRYAVNYRTIGVIVRGENWRHLNKETNQ